MDAYKNVAKGVGDYGHIDLIPTAFGGHGLYVRKCITGDPVDNGASVDDRQIGGIVLPQAMVDQTCFVEILAIGPNVGKKCSKEHARKYRSAILAENGGDMNSARQGVCVPDDIIGKRAFVNLPAETYDERCKRSPASDNERFIEETLPLYYEE